jgi:hypothetical protein
VWIAFIERLVLALIAADVACSESGSNYRDGACVLSVVRNRAVSKWRRYDGTLWTAITSPHQHAHGCRAPMTLGHLRLGYQFAAGSLEAAPFCASAQNYIGDHDDPDLSCDDYGLSPVGEIAHTYCGPPRSIALSSGGRDNGHNVLRR